MIKIIECEKKHVVRMISALAVAFSLCVPVYAAEEQEIMPVASGQYKDYELTIHSGVLEHTQGGPNYTNRANVTLESVRGEELTTTFNVATYTWDSQRKISSTYSIKKPLNNIGTAYIPKDAANHPGEYICGGFTKYNINSEYTITGKFYYDGL